MRRLALGLALLLLAGCDSRSENQKYFDSLPADQQQKIRSEALKREDSLDAARTKCGLVISEKTGGNALNFKPQNSGLAEDEFYFAWPSGSIDGGSRDKPDIMTKSMLPSGMCIGSISRREITALTVNGEDVVSDSASIRF